jgi:uncharacterized cupin superfamily protein
MKIVKSGDVAWVDSMKQGNYGSRRKPLGGEKLSTSLWELPPGKKSFPLHSHHVTEEAMYVVSGSAKVRTLEGVTPISAGDFISFPPGGPAHQLINDGKETLIYLAMSATYGMDIVEYPDTDKVASVVGVAPNAKRFIFKKGDMAQYFDGDKDAKD